jgi:hypothetical protein
MKVTIAPPKGKRKARIQERNQSCVKWQENDSIFFRWFKRDRYAVQFVQELVADGIPESQIRIVQK